ncbi:MAG: coenzyme F420-0:L-glutamate ligase [bacterium]
MQIIGLDGFPDIAAGDNIASITAKCLRENGLELLPGDVLVFAQKIISKSEGRQIALSSVTPGVEAKVLAQETDKDPRLVELVLSESKSVVRKRPGLLITEHNNGYVLANAGIDASNLSLVEGDPQVLLLPKDSDSSAQQLRAELGELFDAEIAVVINDSWGRPWRMGTVGHAIGSAGLIALSDQVGEKDRYGRELQATVVGVADELAAAASLVMGQGGEGIPVVLVRGLNNRYLAGDGSSRDLLRDPAFDLFRDW